MCLIGTDINKDKIVIRGLAISDGHVIKLGAADRRVKAVSVLVARLRY